MEEKSTNPYRAALEVVLEALDIPLAATTGDDDRRRRIFDQRLGWTIVSLEYLLSHDERPEDIQWSIDYLRKKLAEHPPIGYTHHDTPGA